MIKIYSKILPIFNRRYVKTAEDEPNEGEKRWLKPREIKDEIQIKQKLERHINKTDTRK